MPPSGLSCQAGATIFELVRIKTSSTHKSCSCRLGFLSMGRNDESMLFFQASFSIFGPLRCPQGQNSGRSRSLASLQIIFNLFSLQIIHFNHQKIMYFGHYVPWTKIQDDMNKFIITLKLIPHNRSYANEYYTVHDFGLVSLYSKIDLKTFSPARMMFFQIRCC